MRQSRYFASLRPRAGLRLSTVLPEFYPRRGEALLSMRNRGFGWEKPRNRGISRRGVN